MVNGSMYLGVMLPGTDGTNDSTRIECSTTFLYVSKSILTLVQNKIFLVRFTPLFSPGRTPKTVHHLPFCLLTPSLTTWVYLKSITGLFSYPEALPKRYSPLSPHSLLLWDQGPNLLSPLTLRNYPLCPLSRLNSYLSFLNLRCTT